VSWTWLKRSRVIASTQNVNMRCLQIVPMLQSALAPQSSAAKVRRLLVSITELARAEEASRQLPPADSLKSEATTSEVREQL
jgi:hypothetical protein